MNALRVVTSCILGVIFIAAGIGKLSQGAQWQVANTPFSTANKSVDALIRLCLPWGEALLGALLIGQIAPLPSAVVAIVLLLVFSVRVAQLLMRGQHPQCMCFGTRSQSVLSQRHLWRNAALIILGILVIVAT